MTRFRAMLAGGVFALAFTIAGCFGDHGDPCYSIDAAGMGQTTGEVPICFPEN